MNYFLAAFRKYAVFSGRARRKEYWYFRLFSEILIPFGIIFIMGILGRGEEWMVDVAIFLGGSFILITRVPYIAVTVRRMHDVGKSGWYLLIPIYNLILTLTEGQKGGNQYGPDPKSASDREDIQEGF